MSVRLNPELKLRYRQGDSAQGEQSQGAESLAKYLSRVEIPLASGGSVALDPAKTKHRYLQEQYSVSFSFDLNAGKKHEELAFAKPEELKQKIDDFNNKFNQAHWHKLWKYGIDRGNIELATLCLAKFEEGESYEYRGKKFLRPRFPGKGAQDLTVYELRREKYTAWAESNLEFPENPERRKKRRVVANLSYFIDRCEDTDWFEKKTASCLDLTTAKVIRGKIVSNGDILTLLQLKKVAAKRILFDFVAQGQITGQNRNLEWASDDLCNPLSIELRYQPSPDKETEKEETKKEAEKRTVYFYENDHGRNFAGLPLDKQGHAYSREGIQQNLQRYLDGLLAQKAQAAQ